MIPLKLNPRPDPTEHQRIAVIGALTLGCLAVWAVLAPYIARAL